MWCHCECHKQATFSRRRSVLSNFSKSKGFWTCRCMLWNWRVQNRWCSNYPGFGIKAKFIIHAVGPVWHGGDDREAELLYSAYKNSLVLANENNCRSIAFPLISSGIYGYPKNQAWQIAIQACSNFIKNNSDYHIRIIFAVLSDESRETGEKTIANMH